jgi:sugar lactone lactonase YvrE
VKMRAFQLLLCLAIGSLVSVMELAQEIPNTPATLQAAAIKAYQQKDYAGFLAYEKRALALEPANPRFLYNVACGESLTGHAEEAIHALTQLADLRLDLGAETDDDFAAIRKSPEWAAFESRLTELRRPLVRSNVAFKLPDPALVATGIAIDARTGDTYIASVRERKIVRRTRNGVVSDFIPEAEGGFLAGASLALDAERNALVASTAAVPFMRGYRKEDEGKSGVFVFDLKSGKLLRKAFLAVDGKPHFLNALLIDHDGNIFVSDSGTSGVYRLRRGGRELEAFVTTGVFTSTQGLAFSADEKTMFIADYSDGVWALDMSSKERRHLDGPADVWLGGLDGLSRVGNSLIAVQIGVRPERVLRLNLDERSRKISGAGILEMNHPGYDGPIQGVIDGKAFVYIANSQLRLGNGQTGAFAGDRARPTVVLRMPL